MVQIERMPLDQSQPHSRWGWLRVLMLGIGLFVVTTIVMFVTGNPNLYPTVILIGNFLIPVVFVTLLYDYQQLSALSPITIAQCFALGGLLGVLGASVLPLGMQISVVSLIISVFGLAVLGGLWRQALRRQAQEPVVLVVSQAEPSADI